MGEVAILQLVLKLASVESAGQWHWGDPDRTDIKDRLDETRGRHPATLTPSGDVSSHGLAQIALGIQSLMVLLDERLSGPSLIS